jgi:hypothetical protein
MLHVTELFKDNEGARTMLLGPQYSREASRSFGRPPDLGGPGASTGMLSFPVSYLDALIYH